MLFTVKHHLVLGLVLFCSACAQVGPTVYQQQDLTATDKQFISNKPEYLQADYLALLQQGRRNQTLNYLQLGAKAFNQADISEATFAFDSAIADIQSVYANTPAAVKARSSWYSEDIKIFKGEPYERAMAYFYRGVLFILANDFGNARASFQNAIMQDAFAEELQHRSDFYLMLYLSGWSALMMDKPDLAQTAFNEIAQAFPDFIAPTVADTHLTLVFTGAAPRKLADGVSKNQLVYRRGKFSPDGQFKIGANSADFIGDIFWQANSRGGRPIDRVIDGQVTFKADTRTAGSLLATSGADVVAYTGGTGATGAIAGIAMLGVGLQGISNAINVRADTRYWHNLPDRVHLFAQPNACDDCDITLNDRKVEHTTQWTRNNGPTRFTFVLVEKVL